MRARCLVALPLAVFASVAVAQQCPATNAADMAAIYPSTPLTYPMTSDRYAVQYSLNGGGWTNAQVYISVYGGTNSSPYEPFTNYPSYPDTSMSFVSIPASANADVQLRVTNLWDAPFLASDNVSVRPKAKQISAALMSDGTVQISTWTSPNFAGEQFILWWQRDATDGGAIQGLAFFLDPPYATPTGSNVKIIAAPTDLTGDLSAFDTLDFEGTIAIGGTGPEGPGAQVFNVPANINNVFLAPGAWVQGKLSFVQSGAGHARQIYGPGVLDVSRFNYMWRLCRNSTVYPEHQIDGYQSVSWPGSPALPDTFVLDGIIISDSDFFATDDLVNGVANNLKIIGWNGDDTGIEMGLGTSASNVFIRTGDDSLEIWDGSITVTNATVWQNANGGVVNLGWSNKYPGDYDVVDGLYVVKTDWSTPTAANCTIVLPSACWVTVPTDLLNHQNNAVIASLMTPGANFGTIQPPVYRNIYVDDTPQVLLSLKILPPDCDLAGLPTGGCPAIDLTQPSVVNLQIENLFTPPSVIDNSIGFQTLPAGFTYDFPVGVSHTLAANYTLTGNMNIALTNVLVEQPNGSMTPLTSANAASVGQVTTNGNNVDLSYTFVPGVSSVTSSTASGTYGAGSKISIQVIFTGTVTVTGAPQLALNSEGTAKYSSGSGSTTLTFTYTVGANDSSTRLDYASTGALTLNGGTIQYAGSNNASLTLAAPGATGSLGADANITIGAPAPAAFFDGEVSLGSGVYYLQFPDGNLLGYYNFVASSIFYHYDMGYEAFIPGSIDDLYLYDFTSGHWWYTSNTSFPYLYDFTLKTWIYYFPNPASPGHYTTNPRYFSNLTTGQIFKM
jgi:hypothetical protein